MSTKTNWGTAPTIPPHTDHNKRRISRGMKHIMQFSGLILLGIAPFASGSIKQVEAASSNGHNIVSIPLLPHQHVMERARRERRLTNMTITSRKAEASSGNEAIHAARFYQGYGTHYIDLWCGTPPQRQTVILDTGSGTYYSEQYSAYIVGKS